MSAIAFFVVLCLVLAYILYDTSRRNKRLMQPELPTVFKKNNSYMIECQILKEMARKKSEQNKENSKFKVSMHFKGHENNPKDCIQAIQKMSKIFDFYLIVNTTEETNELNSKLELLLGRDKVFRCKTYEGQLALIRQLNSRIHIQTDINVILTLKPYLNKILTTQTTVNQQLPSLKTSINVYTLPNLPDILQNLPKL